MVDRKRSLEVGREPWLEQFGEVELIGGWAQVALDRTFAGSVDGPGYVQTQEVLMYRFIRPVAVKIGVFMARGASTHHGIHKMQRVLLGAVLAAVTVAASAAATVY